MTRELLRLLTLLSLLTNPYHTAHGLLMGPYHERSQPPKLSTSSLYIYAFSGENIFCVNQWQNTANRMAHYLTTGKLCKIRIY